MNKLFYVRLMLVWAVAILGCGVWLSEAQGQVSIEISDIEFRDYQTPEFDEGRTHPSAGSPSDDWLQIVVEFEAEPDNGSDDEEWLDELSINWHVLINGGRMPRLYFQTSTTYVDIEYEEEQYVAVYIRPETIRRYFGDRSFPRERDTVAHLEFLVDGRPVAEEAYNPGRQRVPDEWWNSQRMNRVSNGLLAPDQTPFEWLDYEFYLTLKPDTGE